MNIRKTAGTLGGPCKLDVGEEWCMVRSRVMCRFKKEIEARRGGGVPNEGSRHSRVTARIDCEISAWLGDVAFHREMGQIAGRVAHGAEIRGHPSENTGEIRIGCGSLQNQCRAENESYPSEFTTELAGARPLCIRGCAVWGRSPMRA